MSFEEVYSKHYNELKRFGRHFNFPVDISEDLTQEVFLRYYMELTRNVVFENPRAWLYKVLLNLFKTQIKSRERELITGDINKVIEKSTSDFLENYDLNEKQRIVFEMLNKLPRKEREILLLYHNDFSYSEIAEILDINPNSVGKTIVRAIKSLKETLKIQYNEMFEQN